MPDVTTENKVEYGLKNVAYATFTVAAGVVTYATPVAIPGAVTLSVDPKGDPTEFYADDCLYFTADNNQGYDGTLEIAELPDSYRKDVLGETLHATDKTLAEYQDAKTKQIALMGEMSGDQHKRKVVFYCCTTQRPSVNGSTKTAKSEPGTTTLKFTAIGRSTDGLIKAVSTKDTPAATLAAWNTAVYVPTVTE